MKSGLLGFGIGLLLGTLLLNHMADNALKQVQDQNEVAVEKATENGRVAGCSALLQRMYPPQLQVRCALRAGKLVATSDLTGVVSPIEE